MTDHTSRLLARLREVAACRPLGPWAKQQDTGGGWHVSVNPEPCGIPLLDDLRAAGQETTLAGPLDGPTAEYLYVAGAVFPDLLALVERLDERTTRALEALEAHEPDTADQIRRHLEPPDPARGLARALDRLAEATGGEAPTRDHPLSRADDDADET
jgi:hypothetical protein